MPGIKEPQRVSGAAMSFKTDYDGDVVDSVSLEELGDSKNNPRPFHPNTISGSNPLPQRHTGALSPAIETYHAQRWRRMTASLGSFWKENRAVVLVAVAQFFGAVMNVAARLLEEEGMHPLQILFSRMIMTTLLACLYMWWYKVPDFPLGAKAMRFALVVRGVTGFFGIYGMWYSMMFLPLAEATVITFLAPMLAGYICHVLLKDPFTRREQLAFLLALAGVILIARPISLFGSAPSTTTTTITTTPPPAPHPSSFPANSTTTTSTTATTTPEEATPPQRLLAILVALLGVLGGAAALSSIRYIGTRAHALITVTYFTVCSTLASVAALLLAPLLFQSIGQNPDPGTDGAASSSSSRLSFSGVLPASAYGWFLLGTVGLCGFVMQFMVTLGLGKERSNRAAAMAYTQMVFAAGFDRWVFGHSMGVASLVGCGMIVGSALWVVLWKKEETGRGKGSREEGDDVEGGQGGEEGMPMLDVDGEDGSDCEEDRGVTFGGRINR